MKKSDSYKSLEEKVDSAYKNVKVCLDFNSIFYYFKFALVLHRQRWSHHVPVQLMNHI